MEKLLAFIVFAGIGFIFIYIQYHFYSIRWKKNYDVYPKCMAKTWANCDTGDGYRWTVRLDLPGKPWAVDYTRDNGTTFNPVRYHLTQPDERVQVYYWKIEDGKQYHADQNSTEYYFHFCEEDRYQLQKTSEKHTRIRFYIIGGVFVLVGILVLFM